MTIWACEAGKDVYVEKPCSHNVHEGRIAVEMARKHKRIVQHGTQSRSSQSWADLAALAKSGKLGKLLVSRGLCYKDGGTGGGTRGDIGHKPTKAPPAELDFNLWLGPAPEQPYHENLVHYRWHWFWDFGNGDIGNQGVHQMDIARWVIPGATWPKTRHQLRRPLRQQRPGRDAEHAGHRVRLRRDATDLRGPRAEVAGVPRAERSATSCTSRRASSRAASSTRRARATARRCRR